MRARHLSPKTEEAYLGWIETDAVYTEIFHVGWPPGSPHRVLRNSLTDGGTPPSGPIAYVRSGGRTVEVPPFGSGLPTIHTEGRTELMANYAGQGVGLIRNVLPAAEIVEQMTSEAQSIMRRLPTLLS